MREETVKAGLIELAIHSCLAQCVVSDAPLICLADYADELRDNGWDEASVEILERRVLGSLADIDN